jgi:creatinine amidohydrolase
MQLALATWQEVEEYLRAQRGIIVPIGSVEQHGPNGLIGTDHLDAEFIARAWATRSAAWWRRRSPTA